MTTQRTPQKSSITERLRTKLVKTSVKILYIFSRSFQDKIPKIYLTSELCEKQSRNIIIQQE